MTTVDDIWAQVEAMDGPGALPRPGDAPMFAETWHGRLVAMAVETVHRRGLDWDAFRVHLIAAIDTDPERPYYDSFLVAMEAFTADQGLVDVESVEAERHLAASYRTTEIDHDDLEVFPIEVTQDRLTAILDVLFDDWWPHIAFGPLIQGAAYELRASQKPERSFLDGYITVDFGHGHFHLCVGPHRGAPDRPVSAELAHSRQCAHAEFQRLWIDGAPRSWMFRMFNGDGEQQITFLLPNPFLDDDMRPYDEPQWDRLRCWDDLRAAHLGLGPDPADRLGTEFVHG